MDFDFCNDCIRQNTFHCGYCVASSVKGGVPSEYVTKRKERVGNKEDLINKPNHYHKNEIDVNGYLEKHFPKTPNVTVAEGFYIGNVIKYVSRYKEKNGLQDLEKAMFNLKILIELEKKSIGS